jgi:hypothetical protein
MKRIHFFSFLFFLIAFVEVIPPPAHKSVHADGLYKLEGATITKHILEACTRRQIGHRAYTINGTFDLTTQVLSGEIIMGGEAEITHDSQFFYPIDFPIYGPNGQILSIIPAPPPDLYPVTQSFNLLLTSPPTSIKATILFQFRPPLCDGITEEEWVPYTQIEDVTNGTFQVPCSAVNQFILSPNSVQPNDPVTAQWDVTNLVQHRVVRISGPGLSPTDRTTSTGSLTFTAPNSPGTYEYTLQILDNNGNSVDCPPPSRQTLTVGGERYFWLVKRMNPLAPITPVGSPFEYYSEAFASPVPPGSNPPASFIRVPENGDFQASSFEEAVGLSPFNEQAIQALSRMKDRDNRNYPPSGLISPDKAQAVAEYQNALESYRQALATFQNATPKPGSGQVGPGNLSHARKTSEEVSPYDN